MATSLAEASPWLHAWHDPLASLQTSSCLVKLGDISSDGDMKLIVCDTERKVLRVYKGTWLLVEIQLLDTPLAVAVIYSEATVPRIASVAIASGQYVFIYRQLRPYKKWTCPPVELTREERDIWDGFRAGGSECSIESCVERLKDLRDSGCVLSARSIELISMDGKVKQAAFVNEMKDVELIQWTCISCMDVLKQDNEEIDAISLLVIGTEHKQVFILPEDPTGSAVLCKINLPSVPVMFTIYGAFDLEWRIAVACRDGKIYSIKNGDDRRSAVLTGTVIDPGASHVVSMQIIDKNVWVACMDRSLTCYSIRGKRSLGIILPEDISEMTLVTVRRSRVANCLIVALTTGEIRMYKDTALIHSFNVEGPVSALRFGQYGREDSTLIIVHGNTGSVTIKILKRLAEIEHKGSYGGPPEQDIPIPIPKKTKLFVEQTQREREHAPEIHRIFQKDLCKVRLETARAYVKTLTDTHINIANPTISNQTVKINVQVLGLGPGFLLKVTLQNLGTKPICQSRLNFSYDPNIYAMGHKKNSLQCLPIPILLPGPKHVAETEIRCVDSLGGPGVVLVILSSSNLVSSTVPIVSASVRMPSSELSS